MPSNQFKFKSKVWLHPGLQGWHFLNLPKNKTKQIKKIYDGLAGGFGLLPVNVTIGVTKWKTSIFYDQNIKSYLLPLKKEIRKKENIKNNDTITYFITIIL